MLPTRFSVALLAIPAISLLCSCGGGGGSAGASASASTAAAQVAGVKTAATIAVVTAK